MYSTRVLWLRWEGEKGCNQSSYCLGHFLVTSLSFCFVFLVSTARPNVIKEHVSKFLMHVGAVYGDTTFAEFDDNFLRDHVRTVAVCDTELVTTERQVIMY